MSSTLKIGHRGAMAYEPENTIASIKKALELGVNGVEIDVHKCASGELVVFHDFTVDRLTNGSGEVSKFTLDQLKALQLNKDHRIPTLKEVLDVIDKTCFLNIELKGSDTALPTCKLISDYIKTKDWKNEDFLISSFQQRELKTVYQHNPKFRLAVLTKASVNDALSFAKTINAYAIHPNMALLSKDNVALAQEKGFKVITWTVNEIKDIKRMKTYAVDGIISDNPDLI